jgi:hypothetical protein
MTATTEYKQNEEFAYAYLSDLRPIQLLYSHGMNFPYNPFAITFFRQDTRLFRELSTI